MIGHKQIVRVRRDGFKPTAIFFELGAFADAWIDREPETSMGVGCHPTVYLAAEEVTPSLDLRFAHGCSVVVSAPAWSQELIALGHALEDAGARAISVSAMRETDELMLFAQGKWSAA